MFKWQIPPGVVPKDDAELRRVSERLFELEFKPLSRPKHDPSVGRSEKELRWALRLFACSSVSLFRDLLRSFVRVREENLTATSYLIMRAMFETVAMAHYLYDTIKPQLDRNRFDRAWDILHRANMGSYYMLGKAATEPAKPLDVGKAIKRLDAMLPKQIAGWAEREYSFLSEFSHPDAFALMHYLEMDLESQSAYFYKEPQADIGWMREIAGATLGLFSIVYRKLFEMAELRTAHKELTRIMSDFTNAENQLNETRAQS